MNPRAQQKRDKVVVAVRASKEITRTALVWALTDIVQPGDSVTLLVVLPPHRPGRKLWRFPRFSGDCASSHKRLHSGTTLEQTCDITDSCSQMILQLHDVHDSNKVDIKIKIISGLPCGAVAAESKRAHANWVILDKHLKNEKKRCLEELQCNIVVMKHSKPKVLRLNLIGSPEADSHMPCLLPPELYNLSENISKHSRNSIDSIRGPTVTPASSPEFETPYTATEVGSSSVSSSDPGTSPYAVSVTNEGIKKEEPKATSERQNLEVTSSESDGENSSPSTTLEFQLWVMEILSAGHSSSKQVEEISKRLSDKAHISAAKALLSKFSRLDREARVLNINYRSDSDLGKNVREVISLTKNAPSGPPPLCSICRHKAPVLGKPPRWFSYAELELATGGFSQSNFLAEGGFGSVYRGVLSDGQTIAVKQHKMASSQGDLQFCSEVEVLSCAQHRNVVMLIGFCVEDRKRLLVYEYICNGSLHTHLYGRNQETLAWSARQKIAMGAARGLRYLHDECRVGCIVHRDMRPGNILLTHDFEPLVGDFGLARWHPDGDMGVETRVIGTFGYLAPEYAQSGQITEKADVYSFGVILVELVTGKKAVDINRPKGEHYLTEWARPLLEECAINELTDPRLGNCYSEHEVYCMLYAAALCIRRDPLARPRMSQVLRLLEGDAVVEPDHLSTPGVVTGSRS